MAGSEDVRDAMSAAKTNRAVNAPMNLDDISLTHDNLFSHIFHTVLHFGVQLTP